MPIKKDKKKSKTVVVKKKSTKGKTSQSQSITVNIQKGKSSAKQPSGKPTIASSIASLANVIRTSDFYRPSETPTPVAPVGAVRTPIKASVATQVSEPMKKSIAVQSEPEPFRLGSGRFNLPTREPVNLKLPPKRASSPLKRLVQDVERNRMAEEERISRDFLRQGPSLKPYYEGTSSEIVTIKRPVKKPVEEDVLSDISTTPLYEGGREVQEPKIKRTYTKSGRYSKKKPGLTPVVSEETDDEFYPVKPRDNTFGVSFAQTSNI